MYSKRRSSIGIPKTRLSSFFGPPTNKDNPVSNCLEFISPFLNVAFNDLPLALTSYSQPHPYPHPHSRLLTLYPLPPTLTLTLTHPHPHPHPQWVIH
jgi:hypothetical protein